MICLPVNSILFAVVSSIALVSCRSTSSSLKDADASAADISAPSKSKDFYENGDRRITFVKIPAGTFMMGSPSKESDRKDDELQHQVTISKAFELQTTEVTQSQWAAVMGTNPSRFQKSENCPGELSTVNNVSMCPNNPVEAINWYGAQAFIAKLNAKADGYRYRLPTEAEWEYAARAGTTGAYAGDLDAMAWYHKNSGKITHTVATKKPNAWGLYDMQGNVSELTADWYNRSSYSVGSVTDPVGPSSGSTRVLRGCGWSDPAQQCRSAIRNSHNPALRFVHGLRLLRTHLDKSDGTPVDAPGNGNPAADPAVDPAPVPAADPFPVGKPIPDRPR